jgi:hypothetical protein
MVEIAWKLDDLLEGTRRRMSDGVEITTTANGTSRVSSGGGILALNHLRELHKATPVDSAHGIHDPAIAVR